MGITKFLRIMLGQGMIGWHAVEQKDGAAVVHRLPLLELTGQRDLALQHTHTGKKSAPCILKSCYLNKKKKMKIY